MEGESLGFTRRPVEARLRSDTAIDTPVIELQRRARLVADTRQRAPVSDSGAVTQRGRRVVPRYSVLAGARVFEDLR